MVERESRQSDELIKNSAEMIYHRHHGIVLGKEWAIGIGAYYDLTYRLKHLESIVWHVMAPTIGDIMKILERYDLKDTIPAAASVEYEWQSEALRTMGTVTNMLDAFDELETRLSCYVKLIERLEELLKLARGMGNRHLREAVLTLHDALCGTYSEDLTIEQAATIKDAVGQLGDTEWDREKVRALDRALRQQGFETVPSDRFIRLDSVRSKFDSEGALP